MNNSARTTLLFAAAALMLFGAAGNAFDLLPDLRGDLIELGVRRSVLGGTVILMDFAVTAMFGMAAIVLVAAIQSVRGVMPTRFPLAVIAAVYVVGGLLAYSWSHSPHHLGTVAMGMLVTAAVAIPQSQKSLTSPLPAAGPRRAS